VTPEQDRAALIALLEAVSQSPLVEADGRWRVVVLSQQPRAGAGTGLGASAGDAETVDRLVGLTGLARAEASLLLAGLPRIDSTLHNFLDSGTREVLGLKVAEAASAKPALAALPAASRRIWWPKPTRR
jgi:hypothetical protein